MNQDSEEQNFLTLINQYRQQNSAPMLQVSSALTQAAKAKSTDMATNKYFSHNDLNGRNPFDRMSAYGYNYNTYKGENISAGQTTALEAFNGWLYACDPRTPGQNVDCSKVDCSGLDCTFAHRENMRNPNFRVIGVGRAPNSTPTPSFPFPWLWTTDFGGLVDSTSITPVPPSSSTPQILPIISPTLPPINPVTPSHNSINWWLIIIVIIFIFLLLLIAFMLISEPRKVVLV